MIDPSALPPAFKRAMERKPALREPFAKSEVSPQKRLANEIAIHDAPKIEARERFERDFPKRASRPAQQEEMAQLDAELAAKHAKQPPQEPSVAALTPKPTEYANDHKIDAKIPDAEQRQRAEALEGCREREVQSPSGISGGIADRRPIVSIILRRVSLLDCDAKWASVKDVLDCCWISRLVVGDREDQIRLEVRQERILHRKDEETEITITTP